MISLHYNNHVISKQHISGVANALIEAIIEKGERDIVLSVDDGDGVVWKYTVSVECEQIKSIQQLNEN
ncbi:MAG: hypothetical protein IM613_12980 [Cytophagales bacterium]|nr:hypothetical protein [Cytophagales bacterium]